MRTVVAVVLGISCICGTAWAEYPTRTIHLIAPFAPGGSADGVARVIASELSERLGQPVIVENKPGGGGSIGLSALAKAKPDGYTLAVGATGATVIGPHTKDASPLKPLQELTPIAKIADIPVVLVAGEGAGIRSVQQLVTQSKQGPGISYGSAGNNTAHHLGVELLKKATDAKLDHVAYQGSAPAATQLVGGHIPLACIDMASALPYIRAGKIVALGIMTPQRSRIAPDIPTVAEGGVPGFGVLSWFGVFAPKGVPEEMVTRLSQELKTILASPAVESKFLPLGADPSFLEATQFSELLNSESAKWKQLIESLPPTN